MGSGTSAVSWRGLDKNENADVPSFGADWTGPAIEWRWKEESKCKLNKCDEGGKKEENNELLLNFHQCNIVYCDAYDTVYKRKCSGLLVSHLLS